MAWGLALAVLLASALARVAAHDWNCFVFRAKPLMEHPFSHGAIALMRQNFLKNLDLHGTGANMASPGLTPALSVLNIGLDGAAYRYDWMRDSALSMIALQRLLDSPVGRVGIHAPLTEAKVDRILRAYARRQGRMISKLPDVAHEEPKWTLRSNVPYSKSWCRPQTDGPGLRAMALMVFANRTHFKTGISRSYKLHLWRKIKFDLDWLAQSGNIGKVTCDLWEETTDTNLFWNRMTMRAALIMGHRFAQGMGDHHRSYKYLRAVELYIRNPITSHHRKLENDQIYLTECSSISDQHQKCRSIGKDFDGAVILALIHSGWMDMPAIKSASLFPAHLPTATAVANTVRVQNEASCKAYFMNTVDSKNGLPGVLYGRYPGDVYGGGNPWVLTTAALASLLYQASQAVTKGADLSGEQVAAWREALQHHHFDGHASEFIAAGDSVLIRLRHHVEKHTEGWHLYEQIDKWTGKQTNARDLSWSYAEVLSALRERDIAWRLLHDHEANHLEEHIMLT